MIEEGKIMKPKLLPEPNLKELESLCKCYMNEIRKNTITDTQSFFEAAMEAFYGKDIWEYLNEERGYG